MARVPRNWSAGTRRNASNRRAAVLTKTMEGDIALYSTSQYGMMQALVAERHATPRKMMVFGGTGRMGRRA